MARKNFSVSLATEHETFLREGAKANGEALAAFMRAGALARAAGVLQRAIPVAHKQLPGRKPKSEAGKAARAQGLTLRAALAAKAGE